MSKKDLLELKLEIYNRLHEILLDYNFQIDLLKEKTCKFDLSDLETRMIKMVKEDLLERADIMEEMARRIRNICAEIDMDKKEEDLTPEERKKYEEFVGYMVVTSQKINNM